VVERDAPDSAAPREALAKVSVRDLCIRYGEAVALQGVSLDIQEHEIFGIIGPANSGKQSFLRALNRMQEFQPSMSVDGEIYFNGQDITAVRNVYALRQKVGVVFPLPVGLPMSIYENVAFAPRLAGIRKRSELNEIVERCLTRAALWDEVKDRLADSALGLSGGQQQRLCIARALAVEPQVILMDEPASALDPIATLRIEELIQTLKAKYTIVIVTHNMQQAARASDYTAFFMMAEDRAGYLVEYGPIREIFTNPKHKQTEDYITGRFG